MTTLIMAMATTGTTAARTTGLVSGAWLVLAIVKACMAAGIIGDRRAIVQPSNLPSRASSSVERDVEG